MLSKALELCETYYGDQRRKGDNTLTIGHPLRVSGKVIEGGGSVFTAAGALLHDFLEDVDDAENIILEQFIPQMIDLIRECSDTETRPKEPWLKRKEAHIAKLPNVSEGAMRILLADKLDNLSSLVDLYEFQRIHKIPLEALKSFNSTPEQQIWYFQECHLALKANYLKLNSPSRALDTQLFNFDKLIEDFKNEVDYKP